MNDGDDNSKSNNIQFLFPNKARLKNMTYVITVHYDVDVEFKIKIED